MADSIPPTLRVVGSSFPCNARPEAIGPARDSACRSVPGHVGLVSQGHAGHEAPRTLTFPRSRDESSQASRARRPPDPAGTSERPRLLVVGSETMKVIGLGDHPEHTIGSGSGATIRIDDPAVAHRHAVIRTEHDVSTLVPAAGHHPILVNLQRLRGQTPLVSGDVISIGSSTMTFHAPPVPLRVHVLDVAELRARLDQELAARRLNRGPLAVVAIRLDCEDDPVLAGRAVEALCATLRDTDNVGWDGGTDVLVLMPGSPGDQASCHRITTALAPLSPRTQIGIARFPCDAQDAGALLDLAARALPPRATPADTRSRLLVRTVQVANHRAHFLDPVMRRVFDTVDRLARTELPVLIQGETGVGKEVVAFALHQQSRRSGQPLVTINCAAIVETLVENELFGHDAEAFTGAGQSKPGLLEAADGGTVFLDEIGECSPRIQAKLLRVIDTRRVSRLGSVRERAIDVRWIAATNRNLAADVTAGLFRNDLLFRLNSAQINVPPLRRRTVEIPLLARVFLDRACDQLGRPPISMSLGATRRLLQYPWPGNVRELRNIMEYLAATVDGTQIEASMLPDEIEGYAPDSAAPLVQEEDAEAPAAPRTAMEQPDWTRYQGIQEEVRRLERHRILEALEATRGIRQEAARLLNMPLRTFHTRMREHDITFPTDRQDS